MLRAKNCFAILIATAFACGNALAHSAEFESLFSRILATPDDPALNAKFAELAEQEGELRLALAALERAVRADPGNSDYALRFVRVRNLLSPAKTVITYDFGISYESNPRHVPDGVLVSPPQRFNTVFKGPFDQKRTNDVNVDGGLAVIDERSVAGLRWRSVASARAQFDVRAEELNFANVSGWSGPLFWLTPGLSMHMALGGTSEILDYDFRGAEASGKLTFSTPIAGIPQFLELYGGYRDFNDPQLSASDVASVSRRLLPVLISHLEKFSNDGWFAEATARITAQPNIVKNDRLDIQPLLRFIRPDASGYRETDLAAIAASNKILVIPSRDNKILVGDQRDVGITASYTVPLVDRFAYVGAGISYTHSSFDQAVTVSPSDLRLDLVSPFAQLVFPDLISRDVDLRIDYRFDHQSSNEPTLDYDDHVVGIRVTGRM